MPAQLIRPVLEVNAERGFVDKKICYCFDLTEADIVADLRIHAGYSTVVDRILKAQKAGEYRCAESHPEAR